MSVLTVKLRKSGKKLTPYVSASSTDGRVQRAFAEQIGIPAGQCVKAGVHKGMSVTEIRDVVKRCAPAKGSVHLNLGGGGRRARRRHTAEE